MRRNAGTTFEGRTPNDILLGAQLEAHGSPVGSIVSATKVEVEGEFDVETER